MEENNEKPTFKWYFNEKIIKTNDRTRIYNKKSSTNLIIKKTNENDEGKDTCSIEYAFGDTKTSSEIKVKSN